MADSSTDQLLKIEEVAVILRVAPITVRRLLISKQLNGSKIGRQWRVNKSDVEAYIKSEKNNTK